MPLKPDVATRARKAWLAGLTLTSVTALSLVPHRAPVKVGLLIPADEAGQPLGRTARQGAQLAVAAANDRGGFRGRPYELVVRSTTGLWGSGSREIVSLIFEDEVWAVVGGLDGRSAHLAEQVATKALVALVSPWATDPTLTQINIPWFFRAVPDDRQQAEALVHEIFDARGLGSVVTVSAGRYDARTAHAAFRKRVSDAGRRLAAEVVHGAGDFTTAEVMEAIAAAQADAVVVFVSSGAAAEIMAGLRNVGPQPVMFGTMALADGIVPEDVAAWEGTVLVAPGHWLSEGGQAFRRQFAERYGEPAHAVAAYTYDSMAMVLAAIQRAGLDRRGIRDALASFSGEGGATGALVFDSAGNRVVPVDLVEILDGQLRYLAGSAPASPSERPPQRYRLLTRRQ